MKPRDGESIHVCVKHAVSIWHMIQGRNGISEPLRQAEAVEPETRAWDDLKCCPAECVACDVPANVVLSDN